MHCLFLVRPKGRGETWQVYAMIWKDKHGTPCGISISITSFDVRVAPKRLYKAIKNAPTGLGQKKSCFARDRIQKDGWSFDPEKAFSLGLYAHSKLVASNLKWVVRRRYDAECLIKTKDALTYFSKFMEAINEQLAKYEDQIPLRNLMYVDVEENNDEAAVSDQAKQPEPSALPPQKKYRPGPKSKTKVPLSSTQAEGRAGTEEDDEVFQTKKV